MRNHFRDMKHIMGFMAFLVTLLAGVVVFVTDNATAAPAGNNVAIVTIAVVQPAVAGVNDKSDFNPGFNNPFFNRPFFNPFFVKPAVNPFFVRPDVNPFFVKPAFNPFFVRPAFNPFLFNPFFDVDEDAFGPFEVEFDEFD